MAERPYIVGNWKMNGTRALLSEARAIDRAAQRLVKVEVALAPPYTLIHAVNRESQHIGIGAQDCHPGTDGAHTGDISATMVADSGAKFVILGHSERRITHGEDEQLIGAKRDAALTAGLKLILCCGESREVRDGGQARDFVLGQLRAILPPADSMDEAYGDDWLTIAYEPVWAIGTGLTAAPPDIETMHADIRRLLTEFYGQERGETVRILYGGSVKAENAAEILAIANVDGALVGGASLSAESFLGIVHAAAERELEA
jgi:triosephosphate isomerase